MLNLFLFQITHLRKFLDFKFVMGIVDNMVARCKYDTSPSQSSSLTFISVCRHCHGGRLLGGQHSVPHQHQTVGQRTPSKITGECRWNLGRLYNNVGVQTLSETSASCGQNFRRFPLSRDDSATAACTIMSYYCVTVALSSFQPFILRSKYCSLLLNVDI